MKNCDQWFIKPVSKPQARRAAKPQNTEPRKDQPMPSKLTRLSKTLRVKPGFSLVFIFVSFVSFGSK
jgi:hypothetical protein